MSLQSLQAAKSTNPSHSQPEGGALPLEGFLLPFSFYNYLSHCRELLRNSYSDGTTVYLGPPEKDADLVRDFKTCQKAEQQWIEDASKGLPHLVHVTRWGEFEDHVVALLQRDLDALLCATELLDLLLNSGLAEQASSMTSNPKTTSLLNRRIENYNTYRPVIEALLERKKEGQQCKHQP